MPAVSVVIPTYNRGPRVQRAVASVLTQTFADFELLVVDDGSRDGTGESLAGIDERLRYHWQANAGPSAARNTGIRLARAPIVAFLDADNRWLPEHLDVLVTVLSRHPEAVLASTCPWFSLNGQDRPEEARLVDGLPVALVANRVGYVSCVAARRDALLEVEGFDERLPVGEDDDLWVRLAMKGSFVIVRRRTVVRRHTHGGLRDRGRRSGAYTEANTRSLTRAIEQLERQDGAGNEELLERARARLHVLTAVGALEREDAGAARVELARACALLPELERNPGLILGQVWKSAHGRAELGGRVEAAAAAMPNPDSHTALFLRGYAAVLCLTRGRLGRAAGLVLRRPHLVRRDFIAKARRPATRMTRDRLGEVFRGSRESAVAMTRGSSMREDSPHGERRGDRGDP